MRASSLALRLFLTAIPWITAFLFVAGFVLSTLYRQGVERAFDRRLGVYMAALVAEVSSPDLATEKFPQAVGEPLFEIPLSGWYWQVARLDNPAASPQSSRSLWDASIPRLDEAAFARGTQREGYVRGPEDQKLRLIERTIDLGEEGRFLVAVAGDATEIDEEIRRFNRALSITFLALAVMLLLTTVFQVRFGLAPLKRISASLAAIRSGTAERLEGRFPEEIAPLARETNALIEANREIVERARLHVGNLAHALKTPLSVVMNEAAARNDDPLATKVREQVDIMRVQVARHLERARLAARSSVAATVTEVRPVLLALGRTMEKIHRDRDIAIDIEAAEQLKFRGESQDLEEMVGNLVDNACKWAQSRVRIEALVDRQSATGEVVTIRIIIDDDGGGLSPAERAQVARRGMRLDETKPGSGLGLSIVTEVASLYGGALHLGTAPIGGLRAELVLPGT
jgi:signal transduction histidine kinase